MVGTYKASPNLFVVQVKTLLGLLHPVPLPPTPLQFLGVTRGVLPRVGTVSKGVRLDTPSKALGVLR